MGNWPQKGEQRLEVGTSMPRSATGKPKACPSAFLAHRLVVQTLPKLQISDSLQSSSCNSKISKASLGTPEAAARGSKVQGNPGQLTKTMPHICGANADCLENFQQNPIQVLRNPTVQRRLQSGQPEEE